MTDPARYGRRPRASAISLLLLGSVRWCSARQAVPASAANQAARMAPVFAGLCRLAGHGPPAGPDVLALPDSLQAWRCCPCSATWPGGHRSAGLGGHAGAVAGGLVACAVSLERLGAAWATGFRTGVEAGSSSCCSRREPIRRLARDSQRKPCYDQLGADGVSSRLIGGLLEAMGSWAGARTRPITRMQRPVEINWNLRRCPGHRRPPPAPSG